MGINRFKRKLKAWWLNNSVRTRCIRRARQQSLARGFPSRVRRVVVYLSPCDDIVVGGILSICSQYEETARLSAASADTAVVVCTLPGGCYPLLRYTRFRNQVMLYDLEACVQRFQGAETMLIHIPEYAVQMFVESQLEAVRSGMPSCQISLNVMVQNINLVKLDEAWNVLRSVGQLSCTAAHEAYANAETESWLGCPVHKLSVFVSPEQYIRVPYQDKEELMIVSPDQHPDKVAVLRAIKKELPKMRVRIVERITYEQFKDLIARAKWALTFGEGLDGYFLETILSGGVSFAVFNREFFTDDYRALRTVYPDFEALRTEISSDIRSLDHSEIYNSYQQEQYGICVRYYSYETYQENVRAFYERYFPLS